MPISIREDAAKSFPEQKEDSYITFRKKEISALESKLQQLTIDYSGNSAQGALQRQNYVAEKNRIGRRISKLRAEIFAYESKQEDASNR